MSFCRPLLSPVHIPKFSRHQFATRYAYVVPTAAAGAKDIRPNLRLSGGVHNRDKSSRTTSPPVFVSSPHIPKRLNPNTISEEETTRTSSTPDKYEELRTGKRALVANLPAASYLHVLEQALECKDSKLAESVVLDILEAYQGADAERENMLRTILSRDISLLSPDITLRILEHLKSSSPSGLSFLTTRSVGRLAHMISDSSKRHDADRPFLRLIHPLLLQRLETLRSPGGVDAIDFCPPEIIYAAFAIAHKLLSMSFTQHAFALFQALVKSKYIPAEALHDVDASSEDVKVIISTTLIRASLHWNWRALAAGFLADLLTPPSAPDKYIIDLNIDAIYALLDTPTTRDIRACGHLIRRVHKHEPVPHSIIRQFYNSAAIVEAKEEAEHLYSFTRTPSVGQTHQYPSPQGVALPWLMRHLSTTSPQTHLARTLATEAMDDNLAIPLPFRAQFIADTAARGYGTLARALWERYATTRDGAVVYGNSALLIRMVSLFWNIHTRTEAELRSSQGKNRRGARRLNEQDLKARSEDVAKFVQRVIEAFRMRHAPLAAAPHWVLTSLARACFIVGKIPDGFDVLRLLMDRREVPDMYDANVMLTAVAQLDPRLASKVVERMAALGLRPNAVSFGTTLHFAVLQGDREVADTMIQHIRGLQDKHISLKTLTNLVHKSITLLKDEPKEELRTKLDNIRHLIMSFPEANIASSLQTAKSLVYASLRAEDGVLAFKFWKMLLRRGAEWGDREQQFLRHSIARLIQQPASQLEPRQVRVMLAQLGQRAIG